MNNKLFHFICFFVCAAITYVAIGNYSTYTLAWVIFLAIAACCGMIVVLSYKEKVEKEKTDEFDA